MDEDDDGFLPLSCLRKARWLSVVSLRETRGLLCFGVCVASLQSAVAPTGKWMSLSSSFSLSEGPPIGCLWNEHRRMLHATA